MFLMKLNRCSMLCASLFIVHASVEAAEPISTLSLEAMIANKGLGCELVVPTSLLQFKPLQLSQLNGTVQTYQVLPLTVQLRCVDESEAITPTLTIEGETPYVDHDKVFLNGTPNGVGFLVRQSKGDEPMSLASFYQPTEAIGHDGKGTVLGALNTDNKYSYDQVLWVGLVGPFQPEIMPGYFQASLTLNVVFE